MKRPLKTVLKYLKKHTARAVLMVLGFAVLVALLQLQVFKKIEDDYKRNTAQLLYVPAPENSPVANIYLDGLQNAKAIMAELTDLIKKIKEKSPESIFVVIDPKELKTCQHLSSHFNGVSLVFKNSDLNQSCLPYFRKNNIKFFSLDNFSLDLGKGEHILVKDIATEMHDLFDRSANSKLQMNMALAFTRIPQIDGREVLKAENKKIFSHGKHVVSLKSKVVFVGFNTQTFKKGTELYLNASARSSDKPYTLKSESLSEDFKLSNLYFHLQEDAFLKATSPKVQSVLWAIIYLQVLFAILYFGPMLSVFTVSAVILEVLALTAVIPVLFNLNMPMSYGLITVVYALIFAQTLKRHEQDRVIKRTQRLLDARSQYNKQLLENQNIGVLQQKKSGMKDTSDQHADFDKYFTQINVVDSVHGIVLPEVSDKQSEDGVNANSADTMNQTHGKDPVSSSLTKVPASKGLKSLFSEKNTENAEPKAPRIPDEVKEAFKKKTPTVPPQKNKIINAKAPLSYHQVSEQKLKKIFVNVDVKKNESTPKAEFKILKDVKMGPHGRDQIRMGSQVPSSATDAVPTMVLNFKNLFANNLRRKSLNFKVLGTPRASEVETQNQNSKKKELFFEALCIQLINDSQEGTSIEFSSHDKGGYIIYVLTNKSLKQFNYKQWLKNAAFFESIAQELKKQGIVIYQNFDSESEYHDLAIGFKKNSSKAFRVA